MPKLCLPKHDAILAGRGCGPGKILQQWLLTSLKTPCRLTCQNNLIFCFSLSRQKKVQKNSAAIEKPFLLFVEATYV
jgi:hypothetical protein